MKNTLKNKWVWAAVLAAAAGLAPGAAWAADGRTPLPEMGTSGVIMILQPGSYYLTRDITVTSGSAISIQADGVTVDLDGHTVTNLGTSPASDFCVTAFNRTNVRLTNGQLVGGYFGVYFLGGGAVFQVDHVSVTGSQIFGIYVGGGPGNPASAVVESCRVMSTVGAFNSSWYNAGIRFDYVDSGRIAGCEVRDTLNGDGISLNLSNRNTVAGNTSAGSNWDGILLRNCFGNTVSHNTCSGHAATGSSNGIELVNSSSNALDWNELGGNYTGLRITSGSSNEYGFNHAAVPATPGYAAFVISPATAATTGGGNCGGTGPCA